MLLRNFPNLLLKCKTSAFFRLYLTSSPKKWDKKYIFFLIIYWLLCNKPRHFRKRKKEIHDADSQFHFQNFKSRHCFSFLIDSKTLVHQFCLAFSSCNYIWKNITLANTLQRAWNKLLHWKLHQLVSLKTFHFLQNDT